MRQRLIRPVDGQKEQRRANCLPASQSAKPAIDPFTDTAAICIAQEKLARPSTLTPVKRGRHIASQLGLSPSQPVLARRRETRRRAQLGGLCGVHEHEQETRRESGVHEQS